MPTQPTETSSKKDSEKTIVILPPEILYKICFYLDLKTIGKVTTLSKSTENLVTHHLLLWKQQVKLHFPHEERLHDKSQFNWYKKFKNEYTNSYDDAEEAKFFTLVKEGDHKLFQSNPQDVEYHQKKLLEWASDLKKNDYNQQKKKLYAWASGLTTAETNYNQCGKLRQLLNSASKHQVMLNYFYEIFKENLEDRDLIKYACYCNQSQARIQELIQKNNLNDLEKIALKKEMMFDITAYAHPKVMEIFVCFKTHCHPKDALGRAPLHFASFNECVDVVKLLLKSGAPINEKSNFGSTALHDASRLGHLQIVELLLKNGALPNKKNSHRDSPLHYASDYGNPQIVKLLLNKGALINEKNSVGMTPLRNAVYRKRLQVVKLLLENGARINEKDVLGRNPLHYAFYGEFHIIKPILKLLLLNLNKDSTPINEKENGNGWTPLHCACNNFCNHPKLIKLLELLLGKGAKSFRDKVNKLPSDYLQDMENAEIHSAAIKLLQATQVTTHSKSNATIKRNAFQAGGLFVRATPQKKEKISKEDTSPNFSAQN